MRIQSAKQSQGNPSKAGGLPQLNPKRAIMNSRMLDNHWDGTVHGGPWISPGKQPDYAYNYNDSGLGFMMRNQYDNLLQQKREQIMQKTEDFRHYKELDDIRETDCIVTIEYCTDCKSHDSTTRHDEQKYLNVALQLKKDILNHFPCIKVYLKPNVVDPSDKSVDNIYVRRRIGALEVQIAAGQDDGSVRKGVLHSKLTSGNWPNHKQVLNQMRDYMQKTNFTVILDLQDFDLADVAPEQLRNKKINKLYDIPVILKPYRERKDQPQQGQNKLNSQSNIGSPTQDMQQSQGQDQYFKNNRPQSGVSRISRPKSAYSTISNNQSMKSLHDQMGQSKKNNNKSQEMTDEQLQQMYGVIKLKTDIDGTVEFKDIPYDVYTVEIKETNEYKGLRRKIDIFEKIETEELMEEKYTLSHLNKTFLKITCSCKKDNQEGYIKNGKIIITPLINNSLDEENQVMDTINGIYDVTLNPGQFFIQVEKRNWETIQCTVTCKPGAQEVDIGPMVPAQHEEQKQQSQKSQRRQLISRDENRDQQQQQGQQQQQYPLKNSQQQQNQQQAQQNSQQQQGNRENQQGPQKQTGRPSSAKKNDQRPISAKTLTIYIYDGSDNTPIPDVNIFINEKKLPRKAEDLKTDKNGVCKVVLQNILEGTLEISHPDYIKIEEEYAPTKMDLNKMKDMTFPLMQKPQNENEVHIRVLTNIGKRVMTLNVITPNDQKISESNEDVEIENRLEDGQGFLKIKNINPEKGGIYRIYSTLLEPDLLNPSYIKVYAISRNEMKFVEVPKTVPNLGDKPKYWDIGFVRASKGDFIEINAQTSHEIKRDWILSEYQNLLNFFKTSDKYDTKQILGFNSNEKMDIGDDTLVKCEIILASLDKYGFEDSKNIKHLLLSAIQLNGLYSFNKLNIKFSNIQPPYDWIDGKVLKDEEGDEDEQYLVYDD